MVIFIVVYCIGLIYELCWDYKINKVLLNEILSGNYLMEDQMKLIKLRRFRYKFSFILLRAILWPVAEIYSWIYYVILKKKSILDYYK